MKKFITGSPMQPEGKLNKVKYNIVENSMLEYGETRFPIIPVINAYCEDNDKIEILLIMTDHENARNNKRYLIEELDELCGKRKIEYKITEINTKYEENIQVHLDLFEALIEKLNNEDELCACLTYGNKPTPIVEMMALKYAYQALDNVNVKCIAYGMYNHNTGESQICDVTSLLYLDAMVHNVVNIKPKNPTDFIKRYLDM